MKKRKEMIKMTKYKGYNAANNLDTPSTAGK